MREVNFSIPNVNKASVNITTTLYDRRALDCTSTLPLINSLNHLAYLTTSSARIRDILTIDGGIERLVCILKEGRSNDLMEMWKWSLAFQCVVNIGVRGSESVRTRVVEADMVPVIATILDNYMTVFEKMRARSEPEPPRLTSRQPKPFNLARGDAAAGSSGSSGSRSGEGSAANAAEPRSSRRHPPPPNIAIPRGPHASAAADANNMMDLTSSPRMPMTSPPERTSFTHDARHLRSNNVRHPTTGHRLRTMQPLATAVPPMDSVDGFGLPPVRDTERLPSMLPALQTGVASQPDSPTTPNGPAQLRNIAQLTPLRRQRPVLRQQLSGSGESDDANGEDAAMAEDGLSGNVAEPIVGVQNRMEIDEVVTERQGMLDDGTDAHGLAMTGPTDGQEAETFNITHRSPVDGSVLNNTATPNAAAFGLSPNQTTDTANPTTTLVPSPYTLYLRDRSATTAQGGPSVMPRDEDVLMSLQLLAYVSKYCNLRSYFQHTHLVPRLKLDPDFPGSVEASGSGLPINPAEDEDNDDDENDDDNDEYLLPDDVNIFPLVEKFTVRHHSKDMQYWACVVMRNLCRKDESRGGIRQCAYYKCGKWEEFQRQFAKCRRCRRTKYCSKDCQKAAWVYHRHWCHTTP